MSLPQWSLFFGLLLVTMVLTRTFLARLLLSSAMIYLAVGYALGPGGIGVITFDPRRDVDVLERVAEVALLISLFSVGLRLGNVALFDRRWLMPLRLAFISMALTVGLIAVVGVWGLALPLGAAVLLGAILAPTDPVLASAVQTEGGLEPDQLRFALAGEGALNDGTAFPFVMLGLGLLGLHELGSNGSHWWAVDLLWATVGGLIIGTALGAIVGWLVVHLRTRHGHAVGLDEFLSLGLIALTFGAAQICLASEFLAVFAAGIALRRVREQPRKGMASLGVAAAWSKRTNGERASGSDDASAAMTDTVQAFNEQLEKLAELVIVLLVGAMLPYVVTEFTRLHALWWFIPLLFVVLRPLAVWIGTLGESMTVPERAMVSWFGIRGIGSVFYLMFAIRHGVAAPLAQELITLTLATVTASIVVHGISARPLMKRYKRRRSRGTLQACP
jgi:sodium/hydrogen antiporter